jgi:3-dehydroquinate dehydratase
LGAKGIVCGFGIAGYALAIDGLAAILKQQSGAPR